MRGTWELEACKGMSMRRLKLCVGGSKGQWIVGCNHFTGRQYVDRRRVPLPQTRWTSSKLQLLHNAGRISCSLKRRIAPLRNETQRGSGCREALRLSRAVGQKRPDRRKLSSSHDVSRPAPAADMLQV